MTHSGSRARAEQALRLRCRRKTWAEISEQLGYRSRDGARHAVGRLLTKMAANPDAERALSSEALRVLQSGLNDRFDAAVQREDDAAALSLSRELRCLVAEEAKLIGIYAPERLEVHVHQSPSAIIAEAQDRLLAIIDAEVIDEPKGIES